MDDEEMKRIISDDSCDKCDINDTTLKAVIVESSPLSHPSSHSSASKAARNRLYAQTSRARHRAYVSALEQDRKTLIKRLEFVEAENKRMKMEMNELLKLTKSDHQTHLSQDFPFLLPNSSSTNYAISVLDLIFPHSLSNPSFVTNSPRPSCKKLLIAPLTFLVAVTKDFKGRDTQMNWKGNCLRKKNPIQRTRNRRDQGQRLKLLELIRLTKLKIYSQQYGN